MPAFSFIVYTKTRFTYNNTTSEDITNFILDANNVFLLIFMKILTLVLFTNLCRMSSLQEFLDRRKMTEWGSLALVDDDTSTAISLPGVRKGEFSSRYHKPEVRVTSVQFSPTGSHFFSFSSPEIQLTNNPWTMDRHLIGLVHNVKPLFHRPWIGIWLGWFIMWNHCFIDHG